MSNLKTFLKKTKKAVVVDARISQVGSKRGLVLNLVATNGTLWSIYIGINHTIVEPHKTNPTEVFSSDPLFDSIKLMTIRICDLLTAKFVIQLFNETTEKNLLIDTKEGTLVEVAEDEVVSLYRNYKTEKF